MPNVHGMVLPGYEAVRDAFEENLASGEETGATIAVYRNGQAVVDLWGGCSATDSSKAISEDSLFTIFSATKGLSAICIAMLIERGQLSLDAPVTHYWPEFGANGKGAITVAQLMSHQAGLVATRAPATIEDYYAHTKIAQELAAQEPYFQPGKWGYHALTIGILQDELVRRIDGRTINQFFMDEVAAKLGLDIYMGLPADQDYRHVGSAGDPDPATQFYDTPNMQAFTDSLTNPLIDWDWPNQRSFREHGQPAAGASAGGRSLAQLYAMLVCDEDAGHTPLIRRDVLDDVTAERIIGVDQCLGGIGRYGIGFRLNTGGYGSNPASFGHPGMGGTVAFADPTRHLGVAYTTNRIYMPSWHWCDPRLGRLLLALYAAEGAA